MIIRCFLFTLTASLLAPTIARADLYQYQTETGEIIFTTQKKNNLKPIQIIKSEQNNNNSKNTTKKNIKNANTQTEKHTSTSFGDNNYDTIIDEAAKLYDVPFAFIKAVIKVESNFNPKAKSRVGAIGLMQLMPDTIDRMYLKNPLNPKENIFAGTKYLKRLILRYNGNLNLILAAYNAGSGNVDTYNGIPFQKTKQYIQNVYFWYQKYQQEFEQNIK